MINYNKKPIVLPISNVKYVNTKANGNHNEITIAIANYAIPLDHLVPKGIALNKNMVDAVLKKVKSFHDVKLEFNYDGKAPAFTFSLRAKTERSDKDSNDENVAKRIIAAKLNAKAINVTLKVVKELLKITEKQATSLTGVASKLEYIHGKELEYIKNA